MEIKDLRYFSAIAQMGSMTAAAKSLRVSQPTLTVAMQSLEEELGTQLFLRDRSGVRVTATGHELLRHAQEVTFLLERAAQRIQGLESEDTGEFTVGCNESLGAYFLPEFMARFLRSFPGIELHLANDTSANIHDAVLERRVDFGIVVNPHPHLDLVIVDLFHDAMDVMISSDAPPPSGAVEPFVGDPSSESPSFVLARKRLLAGPLIYAGRVAQCRELCDQLAARGLLSRHKLVCGDLELVKSLALAGIGPALIPRRVAAYAQEGRLVRLHDELPFIPDTICLIYRADMHRTKAAMRLKDGLVAYGKTL